MECDGIWKVGDRCRWQEGDTCHGEHTILARDGDMYWLRDDYGGYDMATSSELHPICTPDQRAEDEAVEAMLSVVERTDGHYTMSGVMADAMRRLHRAGYGNIKLAQAAVLDEESREFIDPVDAKRLEGRAIELYHQANGGGHER
ncbi:hypothetical protein [Halomonas sp. NO4]|uniref:hypothetical protein n=1 Tax=Halomonas sp. NO4 TaxID=2484813 RepID=UPI0013D59CF0|nr:hypothetical protein [Halomonas sp. NO4]